jgi:hypothetical protein
MGRPNLPDLAPKTVAIMMAFSEPPGADHVLRICLKQLARFASEFSDRVIVVAVA